MCTLFQGLDFLSMNPFPVSFIARSNPYAYPLDYVFLVCVLLCPNRLLIRESSMIP